MRFSAIALVATFLLAPFADAAAPRRTPPAPATEALAKQLADAVNVVAEDVVLLRAGPDTLGLAEFIAGEVARRGGTVVMDYVSPAVVRAILAETPDGYLERKSSYAAAQLQGVNVIIELASRDDPALTSGIDPVRLARARRARLDLLKAYYQTDIRRLTIGGTSFPSDEAAKLFKADPGALAKMFWDAATVKSAITEDHTSRMRKVLTGLKELRITAPNGTNLTLRLAALPLYVNNGHLDDEVQARPGPKEISLPAGEVGTVPAQFIGDGTLTVDAVETSGVVARDLKFTFQEGSATLVSGGENFETFKKAWNLARDSKDVIGSFSVGTNDAAKPPAGSLYRSPEMAGMVTIGVGFNKAYGGSNEDTDFSAKFMLTNATVKVRDAGKGADTVIVEAGQVKVK